MLAPIFADATHRRQLNMVAVHRTFRPEQCLVHLDATAHLHGSYGVRGHGLIHVRKPRQRRRRAAGTTLGHAFGLEGPRGLKNCFVNVRHRIDGILRRFVMVGRVVTHRHRVDIVELRAVKVPIANKFLGELLVVLLHFRHRRAERRQVTDHAGMFAIFVENQPVRVLLRNFRLDVFVRLVFSLAVFNAQRQPPQLYQFTLLVEVSNHLSYGVAGERVTARIPIAVVVEPAVIERGPLDAEFLQLGNRA